MDFFDSSFSRWCNLRDARFRVTAEEEKIAREHLVKCIAIGEITSIDGVESPLSKRIQAHLNLNVFEMNSNWIKTDQDWKCPCCRRDKFSIARPGKKQQILAKLVIHHDHMAEALEYEFNRSFHQAATNNAQLSGKKLVERIGAAFSAFEEVLICEDCNNADVEAKSIVGNPPFFSFSPTQIRSFSFVSERASHQIDRSLVDAIWKDVRSAYELRMRLIQDVAYAAATDAHWYEPYERATNAIPVLGSRYKEGDVQINRWVSSEALIQNLGPRPTSTGRNLSRWRRGDTSIGRPVPKNFVAMLLSEDGSLWPNISADWRCPICQRTKTEIVYVGDKGKVIFSVPSNRGTGKWLHASRICGHCNSSLMSLKLEVTEILGEKMRDSYSFVAPEELAAIIQARPHSPHRIHREKSEMLVNNIVLRMTGQ